jgi:hypothetical protein
LFCFSSGSSDDDFEGIECAKGRQTDVTALAAMLVDDDLETVCNSSLIDESRGFFLLRVYVTLMRILKKTNLLKHSSNYLSNH